MGGVIDADPITPGIQAQPGIVRPVGPPRVVGGPGFGTSVVGGPIIGGPGFGGPGFGGGFRDIDPITPGIQTRPGVITATGPSVIGGGIPPFRRF
jgi:hypothetical protein